MKKLDLVGLKFGKLLVVKLQYSRINTYWKCLCECGNECVIRGVSLKKGDTKSCGCGWLKHGMSETKFGNIRYSIRERCYDVKSKKYNDWGGRGIKCLRNTLNEFKEDMYDSYIEHKKNNPQTTIERINNDGDYCKENCRRATMKEQSNNRRIRKK